MKLNTLKKYGKGNTENIKQFLLIAGFFKGRKIFIHNYKGYRSCQKGHFYYNIFILNSDPLISVDVLS